jgi:UDP-N-acetylmuramate--alanine ligase
VTEIYSAGEDPVPGVTGEALYQAIKRHGHMDVEFIADKANIAPRLAERLVAGDVVLTLGAGDIYKVGESIAEALARAEK